MYLLEGKSEATGMFKQFHKMILNHFETNIKILPTYNGREYYSNILGEYLQKEGIIHHDHVLTLQSKMECQKENIVTFLKLLLP